METIISACISAGGHTYHLPHKRKQDESPPRIPNWHENANYLVGDLVKFNGAIYRCKQSHISIQDWIPTATQALWAKTMTEV